MCNLAKERQRKREGEREEGRRIVHLCVFASGECGVHNSQEIPVELLAWWKSEKWRSYHVMFLSQREAVKNF